LNLIKWLVPLLPLGIFALLLSAIAKKSGTRDNRYKTLRFPFLALVYLIAGMILFPLLDDLADWVMGLGFVQSMLSAVSPGGMLSYVFVVYGVFARSAATVVRASDAIQ
jgi:hypothetical protein